MMLERTYYRVDRKPPGEPDEVRNEINPWKVMGWALIAFAMTLMGIYLWHLFHEGAPLLSWKPLGILAGGAGVGGGILVSRGGDMLADILEKKLGGGDG